MIVVQERDNLRLRCQAAGEPTPIVTWSRVDGMAIATGQWKDVVVVNAILNLTYIRRDHTGQYKCDAYNGVGPSVTKTFQVEVHCKEASILSFDDKINSFIRSS